MYDMCRRSQFRCYVIDSLLERNDLVEVYVLQDLASKIFPRSVGMWPALCDN